MTEEQNNLKISPHYKNKGAINTINGTRIWFQGLVVGRVLCFCLSHASPLCFSCILDKVPCLPWGWPETFFLPTYTFHVVGITVTLNHTWLICWDRSSLNFIQVGLELQSFYLYLQGSWGYIYKLLYLILNILGVINGKKPRTLIICSKFSVFLFYLTWFDLNFAMGSL
jgi:hypothetical protein